MFSSQLKRVKKNRKRREKEKNKQITSNKIKSRKFKNPPIKYNLRGNVLLTIYYLEWINNVNFNKV